MLQGRGDFCGPLGFEILRNFAEILRSVAILRSRFCRDLEKFAVNLRSQKILRSQNQNFSKSQKGEIFFISKRLYFWTHQKVVIILMILKGFFEKYFIDLGPFCHFIYLFGPPKPCFYKEKAPSNSRKSKFCGILRNFVDHKNSPLDAVILLILLSSKKHNMIEVLR